MGSIYRRHRGLPTRCWSCWWREGGKCFSTAPALGGELEKDGYLRRGREVTDDHFTACEGASAFQGKRATLQRAFGDIPIVIASEENMKAAGVTPDPP